MLPIRKRTTSGGTHVLFPDALQIDDAVAENGLPALRGELPLASAAPLLVTIRIHNSAGIPIVQGHTRVSAGERVLLFADLCPVGIDAYAHKPAAERAQIAARIWSRRAYGTLQLRP